MTCRSTRWSKLTGARREPESDALADWLDARATTALVTSTLAEVELLRALRRARYELVRATTAEYTFAELRTTDAIHLATAHAVFGRQLTSFVTYDKRLLGAAEALRLPVASPGITATA